MRSTPLRRILTCAVAASAAMMLGVTAAAADGTYEVQPGDTLYGIARDTDAATDWRELAELNSLQDPDLIIVGEVLELPDGSDTPSETQTEPSSEGATSTSTEPSGAVSTSTWDALAECESNGDWSINTGNGFYGGLQFKLSSWEWVGGSGYPHEASKEEQIARAEVLLERQGWDAWPACSSQLGLR